MVIFDVVAHGGCKETYTLDADGNYVATYLRLDVFNNQLPEGTQMDIAYLGMTNNLTCVFEEFSDLNEFTFATTEAVNKVIDRTFVAETK